MGSCDRTGRKTEKLSNWSDICYVLHCADSERFAGGFEQKIAVELNFPLVIEEGDASAPFSFHINTLVSKFFHLLLFSVPALSAV